MRLFIIDGHNLILSTEMLSDLLALEGRRASREEAESLILHWAERQGDVRVSLYYDGEEIEGGHPGNRDEGPLSVRFTDPPAEADDRIVFEASREAGGGEKVTVVTGDGGIRNRLAGMAIQFLEVEKYLRDLTAPAPSPSKEGRFSEDEHNALGEELRAHAAVGEPARANGGGKGSPADRSAPIRPAAKPKEPPVVARPAREARSEAYRKRIEKRTKSSSASKPKSRSKKKKRGY